MGQCVAGFEWQHKGARPGESGLGWYNCSAGGHWIQVPNEYRCEKCKDK